MVQRTTAFPVSAVSTAITFPSCSSDSQIQECLFTALSIKARNFANIFIAQVFAILEKKFITDNKQNLGPPLAPPPSLAAEDRSNTAQYSRSSFDRGLLKLILRTCSFLSLMT